MSRKRAPSQTLWGWFPTTQPHFLKNPMPRENSVAFQPDSQHAGTGVHRIADFAASRKMFQEENMTLDWPNTDWHFLKGRIVEHWPLLGEAEEHLDLMRDAPDMLVGRLQEYYGITREEAERELHIFLKSLLAHA
jgi:hypothetical protein